MDGLDNILNNISNLASEINDAYIAIPLDKTLNISSPIEDMNRNLNLYKNYLYVSHMNSVSIPLHQCSQFQEDHSQIDQGFDGV